MRACNTVRGFRCRGINKEARPCGPAHQARLAAAERPRAAVAALTANPKVYHQLNLVWGIRPVLLEQLDGSLEVLFEQMETCLLEKNFASPGDKVLLLGGLPIKVAGSTNFLKIHTIR